MGAAPSEDDAGVEIETQSQPLWFWEEDCVYKTFNGTQYYICSGLNTWDNAKARCANVGMKLVKIDNQAENDFIQSNVKFANWTGGRVPAAGANQVWKWDFDGSSICTSGWSGCTPPSGVYNAWFTGEPIAGMTCLYQEAFTKEWHAGACGVTLGFVCENPDRCPSDSTKVAPGQCGCGFADTDSDADGKADCVDGCPFDKAKSAAGVCGCGTAETDTDADGVPDCAEECDSTAGVYVDGTCGCGTSVAAAGTKCADGVVPGASTCDGKGTCGTPTAAAPISGTNCKWREWDGHIYWFCTGAKTWTEADSLCRAVSGRKLAQIETSRENAFIALNATTTSWIGANDRTTDGTWRWTATAGQDGTRFWNGGPAPAGAPYYSRYAKWAAGQPATGAAACGRMKVGGQWEALSCTTASGFVCENASSHAITIADGPGDSAGKNGKTGTGSGSGLGSDGQVLGPCEMLNLSCWDFNLPNPACTAPQTAFPDYYDANGNLNGKDFKATATACGKCISASDDGSGSNPKKPCTACSGSLAPPPPGSATCQVTDPDANTSLCKIVTPDKLADGSLKTCKADSECGSGKVCGFYGVPPTPATASTYKCTERDSNWVSSADNCQNQNDTNARKLRVCGVAVASCPDKVADTFPCGNVTEVCGPNPRVTINPSAPFQGNLAQPTQVSPADFPAPRGIPADAVESYPTSADSCPTASSCPYSDKHPWCSYQLAANEKISEQAMDRPKHGDSGSGSFIQFDLDPNLKLEFKTSQTGGLPGPLGYMDFGLNARAAFNAKATFKLGPAKGTVNLIDVIAQVKGHKCGINTGDTRMKLFGLDLLPIVSQGKLSSSKQISYPTDTTSCEKAFGGFLKQVNRTKKAYRDAQELLTQYNALVTRPTPANFANLCTTLTKSPPRGFPAPEVACDAEAPEETINRFVKFYNGEISALRDSVSKGLKGLDYSAGFNLYEYKSEEEDTLFTTTFMVGPIPVNMEVLGTLGYGVTATATLGVSPTTLLMRSVGFQPEDAPSLGEVTLSGTPWVASGVALFVGVGFDFPGLSAKAGIEGAVTLGKVAVPVYAGAQLVSGQVEDKRVAPNDLAALVTNTKPKIPTNRFNVSFAYNYGANVHIRNLLSGQIRAKVKLKFFWFSKTIRATLLEYKGICDESVEGTLVPNRPAAIKNGSFCNFALFQGDGTAVTKSFAPPVEWGTVSMPFPFLELDQINGKRPIGTEVFNTGKAKELFFDSLCQCIPDYATATAQGTNPECYRNEDCCDNVPTCFNNPTNKKNECVKCRSDKQSCNANTDCCGFGTDPNILGCFDDPGDGTTVKSCTDLRRTGESCNTLADCEPIKWSGSTYTGNNTCAKVTLNGVTSATKICWTFL